MRRLPRQIEGVAFVCIGVIVLLSLFSFVPQDIKWISAPYNSSAHNLIGIIGSYLAFALFFIFGTASYFFPLYFFLKGLERLNIIRSYGISHKGIITFFSFISLAIFLSTFIGILFRGTDLFYARAGFMGFFLSRFFYAYLGFWGSFISLAMLIMISSTLLFGYLFVDIFSFFKKLIFKIAVFLRDAFKEGLRKEKEVIPQKPLFEEMPPKIKIYTPSPRFEKEKGPDQEVEVGFPLGKKSVSQKRISLPKEEIKRKRETLEKQDGKVFDPRTYKLPSVGILKLPPALDAYKTKEDIKGNIKNLEKTLSDFGVLAKVLSVQKGPVVTMYELEPQAGVKIQKITALSDDIALTMKASGVRIVAPIPGRGTIGIEVPNLKKHLVYLREVLEEKAFYDNKALLSLAIGKDVKGDPVVADLKEMPHLLIAGTTGSGKTVCVNSIISSILFKAKPDEVKFILVDPKMVELAIYSGIPHLISPVVSEPKKAFTALNWAIGEMESRYRLLAKKGVRNIDAYNRGGDHLPYIIIIIDELADLMIVARDKIETVIQRLAQLSRAVGIHLILATQRPSVDVITGVIKANFPARISFKVSSRVDSRTVLDVMGADKLLGKGDLLFLKPGAFHLIRAQASYVDDEDIEKLTNFVRNQGIPVYEEKITNPQTSARARIAEDDLFYEAVKIILITKQASASLLQRRLRVGYTRAARLLDLMEAAGIVGPFCGSKARELLVEPEGYLKEIEAKGLV